MRLAILGDTHEQHRDVDLPEVDLLIHAGDWTFFSKRMKAVEDFNDWLAEQPIRHGTALVPGNHEFYLEADPSRRSLTENATVLIGERLSVEDLNLWGSPVTPSTEEHLGYQTRGEGRCIMPRYRLTHTFS